MGVYKRGGIFWLRYKERGQLIRRSLGTSDEAVAQAAWQDHVLRRDLEDDGYAQTMHRQAVAARLPPRPPRAARKPSTVQAAAERWLRQVEHDHAGRETVVSYRAQARRWQARWGSLPLEKLDRERLMAWRAGRLGEVKPRTVKGERHVLLSFLKWCQREGFLSTVPTCDPINGVPRRRNKPAALEPSEVENLLVLARGHAIPQVRALEAPLMLSAYAGLRRGELAALRWEDVTLATGFLTVGSRVFRPKSGERRDVAAGPKLLAFLTALRQARPDAGVVCETATRGAWNVQTLTRWGRRLWKDAGLYARGEPVWHACRHHYATELVRAGVDVATIRDLCGHADVQTTNVYLHSTAERKRAAVGGL